MADKIYFYTDLDAIKAQAPNDGRPYGLLDSLDVEYEALNEQFSLTNIHTLNPGKVANAYAVCKGTVLAQEVAGSGGSRLNVFLKPDPEFNFGELSPKIRFFVYRNIKASTLVSGSLVASNLNTLTYKVHEDHYKETNNHNPDKKILGLGLTLVNGYADDYNIEKAFNAPKSGYALPAIDAGDSMGEFDGSVQFEIIIDTFLFQPDLTFARKAYHLLDLAPAGSSAENVLKRKIEKEQILAFLDPAAFFGSFYNSKITVYGRNSTDTVTSAFKYTHSSKNIFTEILSTFKNKSTVYFDVRNDFNYSFNTFSDYTEEILIDTTNNQTAPPATFQDYYAKANNQNWPILILNETNITTTATDQVVRFQFPVGDNFIPLLYLSIGEWYQNNRDKAQGKNKRFYLPKTDRSNFYMLDWVTIKYKVYHNTTLSTYVPIAGYNKIYIYRRLDASNLYITDKNASPRQNSFLDKVFQPDKLIIPYATLTSVKIKTYDDDFYFDTAEFFGVDFVGKIGIAEDLHNISLFAFATDIRVKSNKLKKAHMESIVSEEKRVDKHFLHLIDEEYTNDKVNLTSEQVDTGTSTPEMVDLYKFVRVKRRSRLKEAEFDHEFISVEINPTVYTSIVNNYSTYIQGLPYFLDLKYPRSEFGREVTTSMIDGKSVTQFNITTSGFSSASGSFKLASNSSGSVYGYKVKDVIVETE
ncbi:MAG: hypothetical protein JWO09_2290 [Bacteroidetes bacterium]|nr:hypothetical protein [Bacteroidota bacterium]